MAACIMNRPIIEAGAEGVWEEGSGKTGAAEMRSHIRCNPGKPIFLDSVVHAALL